MRRRRVLVAALTLAIVGALLAWHYQSQLIGLGARWYLARTAARDATAHEIVRRRAVLARVHAMLLMPPPSPGSVEKLFDLATLLAYPVATGAISLGWASYLYTGHARDLARDRPNGTPRRTKEELRADWPGPSISSRCGSVPTWPGSGSATSPGDPRTATRSRRSSAPRARGGGSTYASSRAARRPPSRRTGRRPAFARQRSPWGHRRRSRCHAS